MESHCTLNKCTMDVNHGKVLLLLSITTATIIPANQSAAL